VTLAAIDAPAGLSEAAARERLVRDGPNELPVSPSRSLLRLAREVVGEPMFLLLLACGATYWVLGDAQEALMLLAFVFVVMGISFVQQRRSERSLAALQALSSPQAHVERAGAVRRIPACELVQGDVVHLAEGDRVPADLRLVAAANCAIDESLLTGESAAVDKQVLAAAHAGTLVVRGTARGCVTATGERSALGRIGSSLAGIGGVTTPIQRETRRVVQRVAIVGLTLAVLLALAYGLLRGDWLAGLLAGLTLAMAVLPEELPVVLTLFLGLGAWRLAREKVLARSMPAVELLGATTVLCVDKTGTLTANRMTVRRLWSEAAVHDARQADGDLLPEALHGVLEYAVLASHRRAFDPMETAIGEAGRRWLADTEHLHADWALVEDYPLSAELLAMSRVWQSPDQSARLIAAKGAPEAIADLCHLDAAATARIALQVQTMASEGLRVLGVAQARFEPGALPELQHDFAFEFLGLLALEDPVRPEVPAAIAECHAAGMRVVMMTGDHRATALSIARQAGLRVDAPALDGAGLAALSDAALAEHLATTTVFCRVQPEQKLRLVRAFQARGEVVAMTGDGVNDAPALKAADIGVAMGARGTEVARQAAALVLMNDDFASLVTAVRYGRRVFANLRKAIVFVVAVHVPIVGLSILPVLFGWPMLLMPVHVLFLQLVIDPACSVVFEAEPLEAGAMRAPPRRADQRLFDRAVLARGLWQGAGLLALLLALLALVRFVAAGDPQRDELVRAVGFVALVLSNLALIFSNRRWARGNGRDRADAARPLRWIALATAAVLALVLYQPALSRLFGVVTPPPAWVLAAATTALASLLWFEVVKRALRR
jgi:P-type Ca2+ transporter type 2C